jgi:hypothetical protein
MIVSTTSIPELVSPRAELGRHPTCLETWIRSKGRNRQTVQGCGFLEIPVRTCRVSVCVVGSELMALEEKKKSIICLHAGLGLGFAVPIVMNDT